MNTLTEQRSKISRFGKIALLGIIFGAALALMFALTALAEGQSETTAPEEPVVEETTAPEEPVVEETTPPVEEPVVEETTVPDTEPVVDETTASGEEPVIDETAAPVEEPVVDETTAPEEEPLTTEEDALVSTFSEEIDEAQSGVATIESDKSSYVPGDVVVITGEGWLPSETVSLTFNEDPLQHDPYVFYSVADDNGNILNSDFIVEDHDVGTEFTVYALGQISNLYAQTTFTDDKPLVTRYFTASITPTHTTYGASVNYTITITNTSGDGTERIGSIAITIPDGISDPTNVAVDEFGWSVLDTVSRQIKTKNSTGSTIGKGKDIIISFTATSTSVGSKVFSTSAYGGNDYSTDSHTIQGSQPAVTVNKATPVISWSNPADITYGAALSGTQLNASTPVAGIFVYNPLAGVVLNAGSSQTLSTGFTPTDTANYNNAVASVLINVLKADLTVTADNKSKIYGDVLPAFTASYLGFVLGEDESVLGGTLAFTTLATQSSSVGGYAVTPLGLTSTNYAITFVDGTLTITPAPVAIAPATTTPIVIAGITEVAGVKKAGALEVAGITELPFTGSNIVLSYIIAILMMISGTAIILSSRKMKVDKAKN